ncbi:MAG: hypothetical protein WBL84_01560, partial [Xanthobacteraceae bacterium]
SIARPGSQLAFGKWSFVTARPDVLFDEHDEDHPPFASGTLTSIDAKARLAQSGQGSRAFFVWY